MILAYPIFLKSLDIHISQYYTICIVVRCIASLNEVIEWIAILEEYMCR